MADSIETIVYDRLDTDGHLDDDAKLYVMAALDGTLDEVIQGGGEEGQTPRPDTPETPAGAYLRRVSVAGFRGIGPRADLEVMPGPGLTLVVGANGTGKSSFRRRLGIPPHRPELTLARQIRRVAPGLAQPPRPGPAGASGQLRGGRPARRRLGLPPLAFGGREKHRGSHPRRPWKPWNGKPRWTPTALSSPTTNSATS